LGALFAVAEEEIGVAGGAEVADEDVLGAEAGGEELGAIGFFQVEEDVFRRGLVAWGHHVEPLDRIGFVASAEFVEPLWGIGELGMELDGDFGADFVTAAADRGTDGGEQVGGLGFEVHLHLADGFDGDAGEGATPSGVDGGYGAVFGVDEEDGDAVGGLDGEEQAGTVGGGGVARPGGQAFAWLVGGGFEEVDYVGVDLLEGDELEIVGTEGGLEAAAIFEDVFASVPIGEAKIQHFFGLELADAAGAGAESVDEPGEFVQGGDLEDLEAAGFAGDPFGVGLGRGDRQECLFYFADLAFGLSCFRGSHGDISIISVV